ncbi:MAG TPA: hypothetical protein DDW27_18480, partial [Bacteroidales bacterium]|nr:hypothetical protein [Bacteroidales bacterium]
MKRTIITFVFVLSVLILHSHPWKPSHYIIIDTDGGIDDMRAITMLLASPDVRVLGITTSGGALSPQNAYIKVKSLLNSLYHEGILVGTDTDGSYSMKEFPFALQTEWGKEDGIEGNNAPDNLSIISGLISAEKTKISFICLGSMTTALKALRNIPDFGRQVKEIVWSTDGSGYMNGFNYKIDKDASVAMLKQEIPVRIVRSMSVQQGDLYNDQLINALGSIKTPYAIKIASFFNKETVKSHKFSFNGTDEMVPVFLHYPSLFVNKVTGIISESTPADPEEIRKSTIKIVKGETIEKNQVIKKLPLDPEFYFDDISQSVNEIIEKHGVEEWKSGVFASEMHRHLGIFEIIGVKMGIRAREYFNTGVDEFKAVSYAGSTPPLSCMNDGLQVSTGSTPGHGLLTVRNDTVLAPVVDITYMGRKIRIGLKPDIARKISSELKEINFIYGLDS